MEEFVGFPKIPRLTRDCVITEKLDGTNASIDQMAKDVSAFLVWTAEPKLEARHRGGVGVLIFLLIATMLGYMAYRNVWANVKH